MIQFKVPFKNRKDKGNFNGLAGVFKKYSKHIVIASVLVCVVALWGVSLLKSDTYSLGYLKKDNPIRMESEGIEKDFGHYTAMDIVLKAGNGSVISRDRLASIGKFREDVDAMPEIKDSLSVYDYLGQYFTLKMMGMPLKGTGFYSLITPDEKMAKITFQVKMTSSSEGSAILDRVRQAAAADLPPGITIEPCGYMPVYIKMMKYIDNVQKSSFPEAFVTIMIVIGLSLGSWRLAFLSIFPNLFPIALTMGVMGFFKIPLDIATITIASIAMGIVGDNGVHMLFAYKALKTGTEEEKWAIVLKEKYNPVTFTSIVLGAGFIVFAFSQLNSIANFGIFSAVMIVVSWVGNILVMPAQFFLGKGADKNENKK